MSSVVQLVGFLLAVAGLTWLFGPWVLVGAGVVLIVGVELVEGRRRRVAAERVARAGDPRER